MPDRSRPGHHRCPRGTRQSARHPSRRPIPPTWAKPRPAQAGGIGGRGAIRLLRTARLNGHRPGSLLRYAQQAFGVERLAEVPVEDMPDILFFAENPPKEMVEKREPRARRETLRACRARIRRRVDRLLAR